MKLGKEQKRIVIAFGIFLGFMFFCTLISRAVYASKLPQVSVDRARRMAVNHKVEAEGIVSQGRECAVNVLSGVRVETVYVQAGDKVTPETLLFSGDMEDLKGQIEEQELAVRKLRLQIEAQEKNRALAEQESRIGNARAMEDYVRAAEDAQRNTEQAKADLEKAKAELKKQRDDSVTVTSDENRKAAQARYEAWAAESAKLKAAMEQAGKEYESARLEVEKLEGAGTNDAAEGNSALEEAKKKEEEAKTRYEQAQAAYGKAMANPVSKPDYSAEDSAQSAWEAQEDALIEAVNAANQKLEEAKRAQEDALLEAERKMADAGAESAKDNSLEINRLELAFLQKKLASYQELFGKEGQIYSETEGIVTRIQVSPGERTPDGAAVVYADISSPMQFHVSLTKEQKKYVNQGDSAKLSFSKSPEQEVTVDYIAENETDPTLYDASIFLPEGVGTMGESGKLAVEAQSETFSCCIPIAALREDGNHRKYVYIVSERSGILGKELTAEIVYVKVLDQNDTYAAIEEGVIDSDTELIVDSTEALEDRDVIRYREESSPAP